jgi:hypothetical protein
MRRKEVNRWVKRINGDFKRLRRTFQWISGGEPLSRCSIPKRVWKHTLIKFKIV